MINMLDKIIINKRVNEIQYMMDHFDELPEKLQAKFEGIAVAVNDLYLCKTEKQPA